MPGEITERNIIQHELIGLETTIVATPCKTLENISGQIVDETMNTFKIQYIKNEKNKIIIVPKTKTTFQFKLPANDVGSSQIDSTINIQGTILTKRPEDRIKKLAKIVSKHNKKKNTSDPSTDGF